MGAAEAVPSSRKTSHWPAESLSPADDQWHAVDRQQRSAVTGFARALWGVRPVSDWFYRWRRAGILQRIL